MPTKPAPKIANATFAGSGTAVMSRLQPFKVVVSPLTVSAKNNVQLLFGFSSLKVDWNPDVLKLIEKVVGELALKVWL